MYERRSSLLYALPYCVRRNRQISQYYESTVYASKCHLIYKVSRIKTRWKDDTLECLLELKSMLMFLIREGGCTKH